MLLVLMIIFNILLALTLGAFILFYLKDKKNNVGLSKKEKDLFKQIVAMLSYDGVGNGN